MAKNNFLISRKTGEILHQYPFYIPDLLFAEIKRAAQARRRTVAAIMREALALGLPMLGSDLPVAPQNVKEKEEENGNVRRIVQ